ncbi:MAG: enoyl-CoA hydratase [Pseudomonadaceae bacterium]|nr:enoyl-CoA hydratase [Pseudomonadaceae bacterium]
MSNDLVLRQSSQVDGRISILTLNRPDALNALSLKLRAALVSRIDEVASDDSVEVVILTGAGRAFTAGLDLKELGSDSSSLGAPGRTLDDAIADLDKPLIGAINGFAITGGFELALMCDIIVASTEARFADTHARVGVVPGWGLSQRLPRLIGLPRAKELSLTGNFLDATTADRWGMVNRVVAPDELVSTCEQIAADILTTDRATRDEILRIQEAGWMANLQEGLAIEKQASNTHAQRQVSADKVASRRADIQKRGRSQSS